MSIGLKDACNDHVPSLDYIGDNHVQLFFLFGFTFLQTFWSCLVDKSESDNARKKVEKKSLNEIFTFFLTIFSMSSTISATTITYLTRAAAIVADDFGAAAT